MSFGFCGLEFEAFGVTVWTDYLFYSEIQISMGQTELKNFLPSLQKNIRPRDTRLVSGKCLGNTQLCLCACPQQPPPWHNWVVYHLLHAIPDWIFIVSHFTLLQSTQPTAMAGSSSKDAEWYFFSWAQCSGGGNLSSGPPSKGCNIYFYYKQTTTWSKTGMLISQLLGQYPCHWATCMLLSACSPSGSRNPGFTAIQW